MGFQVYDYSSTHGLWHFFFGINFEKLI